MPDSRSLRARLVPVALACAVLAGAASTASADTGAQLTKANDRLAQLERQIASARAQAITQQAALRRSLASLSSDETSYQGVQSTLMNLRDRLAAAQAQFTADQMAIDHRAAQAYIQGPFAGFEAVLSSGSFSELGDRLQFESAIAQHEGTLASRADVSQAALQREVDAQQRALAERAAVVRRTDAHRQQLEDAFGAEQSALDALASARTEALRLVGHLKARQRLEQMLAGGSGMTITYGQWAAKFLASLGAPTDHRNQVVMVAWESAEGTLASWNPLATTYDMAGATQFNSAGVRNYRSLADGIQAIIMTLGIPGHGYESIVADLRARDDPMTTAGAINASDWCHGCAGGQYVIELVPVVEQYFAEYAGR